MKQLKKTFALFLSMLLCLSAVPAVGAFADEGGSDEESGLILDKWYTPKADSGEGILTLETYVKGTVVHTTTVVSQPLDIVLVLDVSGSMDDSLSASGASGYSVRTGVSYNNANQRNFYFREGNTYYRVYAHRTGFGLDAYYYLSFTKDGTEYFLKGDSYTEDISSAWVSSGSTAIYTETLYYSLGYSPSKLDVLKSAVAGLIDTVYADAIANEVDHRISIVTFASSANTVDELVSVSENYDRLIKDTGALRANGATAADYGLQSADTVMQDARSDSNRVVIFFTDGEPNHNSGFDGSVATKAITAAKSLKDDGAKVYSVGVYDASSGGGGCGGGCDDEADLTTVMNYMHAISSNYPAATSYTSSTMGTGSDLGYSLMAGNAGELSGIFETITKEAVEGSARIQLDADAVVLDKISDYFELPEGIEEKDIKVYYADYLGNDSWSEKRAFTAAALELDVKNKQVRVSNFDFAYYFVPEDGAAKNSNGINGRKLIIEIPIVDNGTGFGDVPTNTGDSGVYQNEEKVENGESVDRYPIPETTFPSFTVIHSSDSSADKIRLSSVGTEGFDLSAIVKEGHLYGGYYHYENSTVGAPYTSSGLTLQPADGAVYFLQEVPKTYLRPATLSLSSKGVKYTWMLTAIDSLNYKLAGFDVAGKDISLTVPEAAAEQDSFCKSSADEMDAVCETIHVEMVYGKTYDYDVLMVSGNLDGYIVCLRFSNPESYIDNGSFDVHPYFVTPDNVKVTGDTVRTLTYTSANLTETASGTGAKNPVSSDVTDFDEYVSAAPYAPLRLMSFVPLRAVPSKSLEVVEPAPQAPVEEPEAVEEPAGEPEVAEEPAEESAVVEEPAEETAEIAPSDASDYEAPEQVIPEEEPAEEPEQKERVTPVIPDPVVVEPEEEPALIEKPAEDAAEAPVDEAEDVPAEEPADTEPEAEHADEASTEEAVIMPAISWLLRVLTAVSTFLARLFGFVK